jgi:hypothetical protein
MRANRGIPRDLEEEGECLKKEKSAFGRNGDIMVQVWNKTCANDAATVNKWRKDRKTNMEINKPYAVVQYNEFLKGMHIRSEVKLETFVKSASFHFTKGLVLRNSI